MLRSPPPAPAAGPDPPAPLPRRPQQLPPPPPPPPSKAKSRFDIESLLAKSEPPRREPPVPSAWAAAATSAPAPALRFGCVAGTLPFPALYLAAQQPFLSGPTCRCAAAACERPGEKAPRRAPPRQLVAARGRNPWPIRRGSPLSGRGRLCVSLEVPRTYQWASLLLPVKSIRAEGVGGRRANLRLPGQPADSCGSRVLKRGDGKGAGRDPDPTSRMKLMRLEKRAWGAAAGSLGPPLPWRPGSPCKMKRVRTVFTPEQLERLEKEFLKQQYVVGSERVDLAATLQLTETQVKVWFQNRRIRWRKQSLEQKAAKLSSQFGTTQTQAAPVGHLDRRDSGGEEDVNVDL
ncbi:uncharacterized protein PHA67_022772 [Liasis olivaceus]